MIFWKCRGYCFLINNNKKKYKYFDKYLIFLFLKIERKKLIFWKTKMIISINIFINIIKYHLTFSNCFSNLWISDKCNSLNRSLTVEDWGLAVLLFSSTNGKKNYIMLIWLFLKSCKMIKNNAFLNSLR